MVELFAAWAVFSFVMFMILLWLWEGRHETFMRTWAYALLIIIFIALSLPVLLILVAFVILLFTARLIFYPLYVAIYPPVFRDNFKDYITFKSWEDDDFYDSSFPED